MHEQRMRSQALRWRAADLIARAEGAVTNAFDEVRTGFAIRSVTGELLWTQQVRRRPPAPVVALRAVASSHDIGG